MKNLKILAVLIAIILTLGTPSYADPSGAQTANGKASWGFTSAQVPFGRGDARGSLNQDAGLSWDNVTKTLTATHIAGSLTDAAITVTGGTIDGAVIGGVTAAAAHFTTLASSGTMSATLNNSTAFQVTGTPINTATISLIQVGNSIAAGSTAANGGTYIGGNSPAAGAGSAADFVHFEKNGVLKFGADVNGNATLSGVTSTGVTGTGNVVLSTSPSLTTPTLGVALATTVNGAKVGTGSTNLGDTAVTQITSSVTGVTANTSSGVITTVNLTTAAQSLEAGFTVTNSACALGSTVVVSLSDYSGVWHTNGMPVVMVTSVAAGSFVVKIGNVDPTNALNGTVHVHFAVL